MKKIERDLYYYKILYYNNINSGNLFSEGCLSEILKERKNLAEDLNTII